MNKLVYRRMWYGLVLIALFTGWSGSVAAQLVNPSFEDSNDEDDMMSDVADHWERWGSWINRETGWSPTRDGDCLLGYHHWRIEGPDTSGVYQDVADVPANSECEFSVYAMRDNDTNIESVELRLEAFEGGEPFASETFSLNRIGKNKWKKISVSGMPLADGVRVLIVVTPKEKGERAGAVKFDDAELEF